MLSSMDTVFDSANDPTMVDNALKASATVTANSEQMPFNSQVSDNRIRRGLRFDRAFPVDHS
jgi:hypothetical protein